MGAPVVEEPAGDGLLRPPGVARPAEAVHGGETAHEASERIAAALAKHRGQPLVAVTHGTVLSMYLAERLGCDAHDLWRSLHMPDAFVLDAGGGLIERIS